jgi:hypothetical protein
LVHFFTAGSDEVRAWTVRRNTKAPGAAGVIHSDFEKGFICADVRNNTILNTNSWFSGSWLSTFFFLHTVDVPTLLLLLLVCTDHVVFRL